MHHNALIRYNGGTYELGADAVADLLARGVIAADAEFKGEYELAPEHTFDEVEPYATPVVHPTGAEARGEGSDVGKRLSVAMLATHRDGQGGR